MSEEIDFFSVNMKKIANTEKDYELITRINPCFQGLSKEKLTQVEAVVSKAIEDIKGIFNLNQDERELATPVVTILNKDATMKEAIRLEVLASDKRHQHNLTLEQIEFIVGGLLNDNYVWEKFEQNMDELFELALTIERDKGIEKIWLEMTDVAFDNDCDDNTGMVLAEDYHIWKSGTGRDEIWHWFNTKHSQGVAYLLHDFRKSVQNR